MFGLHTLFSFIPSQDIHRQFFLPYRLENSTSVRRAGFTESGISRDLGRPSYVLLDISTTTRANCILGRGAG